jgi:hypothetical protein
MTLENEDHDSFEASDSTAMSGRQADEMARDPRRGDTTTRGSRRLVLMLIPLVLLAAGSLVAGAYQLFPFCCLPLLILGPALLHPDAAGPADDPEGPDGNGGSPPPDIPPNLPSDGLLLPDAELAPRRYRGEPASPLIPSRTRRPAHLPERRPVPLRH